MMDLDLEAQWAWPTLDLDLEAHPPFLIQRHLSGAAGKTGLRTGGSFQGLLFAVKWETCFSLIPAGQRHEAGEDAKKTRNCKLASVNAGKLNYWRVSVSFNQENHRK